MRKVKILLSTSALLFLTAAVLSVGSFIKSPTNLVQKASDQTVLFIDPENQTVKTNEELNFKVMLTTGNSRITGIDLQLNFDPDKLQISSLRRGSGVTDLNNTITNNFDNTTGVVSFTVFTLDRNLALNGSGIEVLLINARTTSTASEGSYSLDFNNSTAIAAVNENQNVLTSMTSGSYNISNLTPTPSPTITPTIVPTNIPNSCGGTCGSNFNCEDNLFCYQGVCRNPNCQQDSSCSCGATATPTPTPTRTPTSRPRATSYPTENPTQPPIVVNLDSPSESSEPIQNFWEDTVNNDEAQDASSPIPAAQVEADSPNFLPWIIGSLIVAGVTLIFIVLGIVKESGFRKPKPPVIHV